jgi:hypothetical protein
MSLPAIDEDLINEKRFYLISRWLHTTTEPFDNWEWDGEELHIYLDDIEIETYDLETLIKVIEGF